MKNIENDYYTLWISAGISQFISNVPAALLIAPFTSNALLFLLEPILVVWGL